MSTPRNPEKPKEHAGRNTTRTLTYIGTVVLLVVVVVAFVGAPALGSAAGSSRAEFGSYDGDTIVYEPGSYFARQYQRLAQQVQEQDQEITDLLVRQIWRAAFQRTVFHEALLDLADGAALAVSSDAIDRAVAQWPEFFVDGRFSAEEFNATSSQYRFALREYLEESLLNTTVQQDLIDAPVVSQAESAFVQRFAGPERQFRYLQFGFAQFPNEEIVRYGEENSRRFDQINLSVITINSSEADATSIREQAVNRTASFEDLARNQSRDAFSDDGGEMGWVFYHELEPDFESASTIDEIFALDVGEISPVFETTFGWTIYRVNESTIPADLTDDATVSAVREYVQVFERGLVEDFLTAQAAEFAENARAVSFGEAASLVDQLPQTTGYFPVNYGNSPYFGTVSAPANAVIANGAFDESFFVSLFSLDQDEISEPLVIRDTIFVFQLADERAENPETTGLLSNFAPFIVQEYVQGDVQATVVQDALLVDNFSSAYNRFILGQ